MSTAEENEAVVRECFAHAAQGNFDAFASILSPDYVLHNPDEVRGAEGLRKMVEGYRSVLGDLRVQIDHQFTEGDFVATRLTITGTHEGELMGAAPTGRGISFTGITLSRCRDGRIVEEWEMTDMLGLLRQVGALPEMARG